MIVTKMEKYNIWVQCGIVFITQLIFVFFRTINVNANVDKDRLTLFWSGVIVHISWIISLSLGVNAMLKGNYILILFSVIGGAIGADYGLNKDINNIHEKIFYKAISKRKKIN